MCRKSIFLTFLLLVGFVCANVASGYVIELGIVDNDQDVEERLDRCNELDMGSSDLELIYEDEGMGDPQVIGIRYPGVPIPKGSTIISALVQFQVDEDKGGTEPVNVVIEGDLAADAGPFGPAFSVTNRARTTAQVLWSIPNWTNVGDRGPDQATPDITSIIQEIIDQDGWASGNALVLIISDDPANPSSGIRAVEAGPGDDAATLIIDFTAPASFAPTPADGDMEVDTGTLEWIAGGNAVSHNVYLSTADVIDDVNDLIAETDIALVAAALDPGVTYYWRVDDVDADGVVTEGSLWSFATLDIAAHLPSPEDLATWVPLDTQLSWTAGKNAIMHDVYFGTDEAAVAAADPGTFKGKLMDTSFDPGALESNTTYYLKIDEFALGITNPGPVWSFTTIDLDAASEPDPADGAVDVADSVTLSWKAGETAAQHDVYLGTDMDAVTAGDVSVLQGTVEEAMFTPDAALMWDTTYYLRVDVNTADGVMHPAHDVWSFKVADFLIIDDATTTLDYDNSADPFVTEAMWDTPADLTINGVRNLSLQIQGAPAPEVAGSASFDEATDTWSVIGHGDDIYQQTQEFHYAYVPVNGDGTITARVISIDDVHTWAKAGVMIRETLDTHTKYVHMILTPTNRVEWMSRVSADEGTNGTATPEGSTPPPHWVRLTRAGNTFTGEHSADGTAWETIVDPFDLEMSTSAFFGLAVTSHIEGTLAEGIFTNVTVDGDMTAEPTSMDIGIAGNAPAPIYAALEDSTGAVDMITHPDPAATNIDLWEKWTIPVTDFNGVDLTSVAKLTIGVGDGEAGGSGTIDIRNIRVTKPVVVMEPGDITMPGDRVKGVPDDGDWPGNEHPALAVDDDITTKYLHFKGEEQPTGIQITPSAKQVVTGLTFTTANDASERDPISFELYASNESIDGPYELIASGDIVDFNDVCPWPRFTMNATPITFDNDMAYTHYQVLFPTVRDAASANSMQIAEIELITDIPVLDNGDTLEVWDHDNSVDRWDGSAPGEGNPGGVASITEDDVTYVRVQDTGDPRDYGSTSPTKKTNYSLYLTQPINNGLDGARIELRARIATTGTLDAWRKDGGGMFSTGLFDWPAGGLGGRFDHDFFDGRGNIDIAEKGVGVISFALTTSGLMVGNSGNKVSVDDATQWNTFVINIAANDSGKFTVSVSANGKLAESFEVTAGSGVVEDGTYIAIGSPDIAGKIATAYDVDYISVTK